MEIAGAAFLGLIIGVAATWWMLRQRTAAKLSRLRHDVRGALSPALLMAERMETHADSAVRQAADMITESLERAVNLTKAPPAAGDIAT